MEYGNILVVKGTPDNPTPGVATGYLRAPVVAPPDLMNPEETVPDDEPGLTGRRVRLLAQDFDVHRYTPGSSACIALETDGRIRKGHNEVCRKQMESLLSDTPDGRNRVEIGYGRIADAALRNQERRERQSAPSALTAATAGGSPAATSSTMPIPQPMATEEPVFLEIPLEERGTRPTVQMSRDRVMSDSSIRSSPSKRPRDQLAASANESTEGQAPGPDDGSRGGRINQDRSMGASSQPKLTGPGERGRKRASDGDDDARHDFERAEDAAEDEAVALSKIGGRTKGVQLCDGNDEMSAVLTQGRSREDMAAVRNKFDCKFDIAEVIHLREL